MCLGPAPLNDWNEEQARSHEEDLSAQEARSKARTWLHGSHGQQGWSSRARSSSGKGTQAADRLTHAGLQVPVFPVLRRKADFAALGRQGIARSNQLLVLRALRTDRPETRLGLSTPRSIGGAVERNRLRRRLRELMRARRAELGAGWDLLLIARPEAGRATYAELGEALASLLRRLEIG